MRSLNIFLVGCTGVNCLTTTERQNWLQGKSIVLLYNERFLDVQETESTSTIKSEVYDLLDLDYEPYTSSIKQLVVERSHFKAFKINTQVKTETVMMVKNGLFDKRDDWFIPDRTLDFNGSDTLFDLNAIPLFELKEERTEPVYETIDGDDYPILQQITIERDLGVTLYKRQNPSLYILIGYIGGIIVILWILGYLIVSCLTVNAYEDHMVSTVYPTKEALKRRIKELDAKKYKDVFESDPKALEDDASSPNLDVSKHGCFRCLCRCLSIQWCGCKLFRRCCRCIWCCKVCKQSRTEQLFDAGRELYTNEISVQRLVQTM